MKSSHGHFAIARRCNAYFPHLDLEYDAYCTYCNANLPKLFWESILGGKTRVLRSKSQEELHYVISLSLVTRTLYYESHRFPFKFLNFNFFVQSHFLIYAKFLFGLVY